MARKTNKTAHVLNLLSSGTDKQEPDESSRKKTISPNISVIDATGLSDSLTDLIKDSLDKEMSAAELAPPSSDTLYPELLDEQEIQVQQPVAQEEAVKPTVTEEQNQPAAEPAKEISAPAEADTGEEKSEFNSSDLPDSNVKTEPAYRYVNIMEYLVEDRLLEFLNRFEVCTCHRCQLDTKALALNSLPPKYIVSPVEAINPLMSFYENKYSIYTVTELTKACLTVLDHPRH